MNGDEKALKRRRLRQHKKAAEEEDTAVLPSSSMSHQQFPNKLFDFSLRKQDHSLPSSLRDDGAFLTFSSTVGKRQVADSDLQCKDSQSLFRVEVNTDDYPSETSWKLVDVISNTVVLKKIDFETESSLYVEKKCLESNNRLTQNRNFTRNKLENNTLKVNFVNLYLYRYNLRTENNSH